MNKSQQEQVDKYQSYEEKIAYLQGLQDANRQHMQETSEMFERLLKGNK